MIFFLINKSCAKWCVEELGCPIPAFPTPSGWEELCQSESKVVTPVPSLREAAERQMRATGVSELCFLTANGSLCEGKKP